MWIFTSAGFVSAVEHREDASLLMVRGRDKDSLATMLWGIEGAGTAADEDYGVKDMTIYSESFSDYPWRVVVSKATFAIWVQFEIMNYLNYHNFKNALSEQRGDVWKKAAMNVWADMLQVEDKPKNWKPYAGISDGELAGLLAEEGAIRDEYAAAEKEALDYDYADDEYVDGDIREGIIQMSIERLETVPHGAKVPMYAELVEVEADGGLDVTKVVKEVLAADYEGLKGSEDAK